MRKWFLAAAALVAAFTCSINLEYGDLRYSVGPYTMRHWSLAPLVSFLKPACALDDTGGAPCTGGNATTYTFTGPTTGTVGSATASFTVQGAGSVSPAVTITPSDAAHGGTFTPSTVSLSGTGAQNFTYTPANSGTYNLSVANSGSLTNPAAISFTAGSSPTLAIDSQEVNTTGHHSNTSPLTYPFNNAGGNVIIVPVVCTNNGTTPPSINSASYNGVSMTQVPGGSTSYVTSNSTSLKLYYLKSPATGSNTVSVSCSGATGLDIIAGAISFDNSTSSPVGTAASATNTGSSATASVSLSGTLNGDYIVSVVATGTGVNSATSPNTMSWLLNVSKNTNGDNGAMGQFKSTGGTVTPTFSVISDHWGILAAEVF